MAQTFKNVKIFAARLEIEYPTLDDTYVVLTIDTLEGKMNVSMNDFIIQGVDGEFYSCKESIFYKTYDIL